MESGDDHPASRQPANFDIHSEVIPTRFASSSGFTESTRKITRRELAGRSVSAAFSIHHDGLKHHAVITGGTGSLGRPIAGALQARLDHRRSGSRELDVRDAAAVVGLFRGTTRRSSRLCGRIIRDAPLARLTEEAWDEIWAVNFAGAAVLCRLPLCPAWSPEEPATSFSFPAFSALHPPVGQAAYATAKAALLGFVADLAARHGSSNIRVNAVLPGFLETRMTEVRHRAPPRGNPRSSCAGTLQHLP